MTKTSVRPLTVEYDIIRSLNEEDVHGKSGNHTIQKWLNIKINYSKAGT